MIPNHFTLHGSVIAWAGTGYYILTLDQAGTPSHYERARSLSQIEECWQQGQPYGHYSPLDLIQCTDCARAHGSAHAPPATIRLQHEYKNEFIHLCDNHAEKRGYIPVELQEAINVSREL